MPRSFLIKKERRGEEGYPRSYAKTYRDIGLPPSVTEYAVTPYTPLTSTVPVRLCNGYIRELISVTPSQECRVECKAESESEVGSETESVCPPASGPTSPQSTGTESCVSETPSVSEAETEEGDTESADAASAFQSNVTVDYTYDAFIISDGRSKKRKKPAEPEVDKKQQRFTCTECGKHYATSSNLSRHKQTHRSLDSQQAKKCTHCSKVYVSMPALSMHMLTHQLKHECNVCSKSFSRPWLLQGHMRSHSGDKPYGCAHCGKAFADRSNLRAHMQTHSAFKHYKCKRCNKSFALKSYLNKHYESACLKDHSDPPSPAE